MFFRPQPKANAVATTSRWVSLLLLVAFASIALAEEGPGRSASARRGVVVLGDSLAAGHGLEQSQAFPALLQMEIDRRGWKFTVINAGVSGDTSAGGLRRMDWVLRRQFDVLLLELGGNDGLRGVPPEATRTNLQAIIDRTRARYPDARIVVAGMKMPPNLGAQYREQFESIFPDLAKKNNAALVPFLLEGVGGRPELNQPDRIHPTAEGHRIVATNIWNVLGPVLEKMETGGAESKR